MSLWTPQMRFKKGKNNALVIGYIFTWDSTLLIALQHDNKPVQPDVTIEQSYVWMAVSSHSFHYLQKVLLAKFSLYVHKSSLKPDSFHFIFVTIEHLLTTHRYSHFSLL